MKRIYRFLGDLTVTHAMPYRVTTMILGIQIWMRKKGLVPPL